MFEQLKNSQDKVFFTLNFDEANKWLYANWIGYVSVENVKKGAEAVLHAMEHIPCQALLNDNRQVVGPWINANDWLEYFWMPKADDAGLNYMALILAPGIPAALSAQDMQSRTNGYFEMRLFGEMEKAQNWLRESLNQQQA